MFDDRIKPGVWVETAYGKAVCTMVEPHDHCLVVRKQPGVVIHPCADDTCKDEKYVGFRYQARMCTTGRDRWVANGDLSGAGRVQFLAPACPFTARIVDLKGPYGEGEVEDTFR